MRLLPITRFQYFIDIIYIYRTLVVTRKIPCRCGAVASRKKRIIIATNLRPQIAATTPSSPSRIDVYVSVDAMKRAAWRYVGIGCCWVRETLREVKKSGSSVAHGFTTKSFSLRSLQVLKILNHLWLEAKLAVHTRVEQMTHIITLHHDGYGVILDRRTFFDLLRLGRMDQHTNVMLSKCVGKCSNAAYISLSKWIVDFRSPNFCLRLGGALDWDDHECEALTKSALVFGI